ncbi:uncharacterized protein [Onthophagus taurus]|uniref:uncharacterized protein n=1 Tax=Onthophagus taurus TaxID=166361 RepID=UPI000C2099F6|nr:uncharacterized protein LOC111423919 [Onthophagus taurus]
MWKIHFGLIVFLFVIIFGGNESRVLTKRSFSDQSVRGYLTERICWWNEVCKEEFQNLFRCRCPAWSFCRAPGRYYNAFCSMTATGYIWKQPGLDDS